MCACPLQAANGPALLSTHWPLPPPPPPSPTGGYFVFHIATPPEEEAAADDLVRSLSPGARLTYALAGTRKYELPTDEVSLVAVFEAMSTAKAKGLSVKDWGVANVTLEEVSWESVRGGGEPEGRRKGAVECMLRRYAWLAQRPHSAPTLPTPPPQVFIKLTKDLGLHEGTLA